MCLLRVCLLAAHRAQKEGRDPLFRPAGSICLHMCEWHVWNVNLVVDYEYVQSMCSLEQQPHHGRPLIRVKKS